MPWHSREINLVSGNETVCCWLDRPVAREQLQREFLSGIRPSVCSRCWHSEQQNIESRRQMENRFLDFKTNRDIQLLEEDAAAGHAQINLYQIFLGSLCNSTCVTCGPPASSAWRSLQQTKVVSIRQENQQSAHALEALTESIDWKNAKRFNLLGGEPLLIDRSFDILHNLVAAGNTDCRISFVTNGSVSLSKEQVELCKKFSDISACLSIDGIGRTFEYIRYPLRWDTLMRNLATYRDIFSEITVSFTVSNLNYHERPQIISWFKEQQLLYIENYVVNPPWFSHTVGPGHSLWNSFVNEIADQDRIKGVSIKDYLPVVAQLIDQTP
jgi:MoaA/NifB/PqqE/SkfB family radical SAM enzyme